MFPFTHPSAYTWADLVHRDARLTTGGRSTPPFRFSNNPRVVKIGADFRSEYIGCLFKTTNDEMRGTGPGDKCTDNFPNKAPIFHICHGVPKEVAPRRFYSTLRRRLNSQ